MKIFVLWQSKESVCEIQKLAKSGVSYSIHVFETYEWLVFSSIYFIYYKFQSRNNLFLAFQTKFGSSGHSDSSEHRKIGSK